MNHVLSHVLNSHLLAESTHHPQASDSDESDVEDATKLDGDCSVNAEIGDNVCILVMFLCSPLIISLF